jgi:hypothetical protein
MQRFNELLEGLMGRKKTEPIKIITTNKISNTMRFEVTD